jgi:hypothetical protein
LRDTVTRAKTWLGEMTQEQWRAQVRAVEEDVAREKGKAVTIWCVLAEAEKSFRKVRETDPNDGNLFPSLFWGTVKAFNPAKKRRFLKLFKANLKRGRCRRRWRGKQFEEEWGCQKVPDPAGGDEAAEDDVGADALYKRWFTRLFERADLTRETRTYAVLSQVHGEEAKDIAGRLGVENHKSLLNRYGGQKLAQAVRAGIARTVRSMPREHREALHRHLVERARLTPEEARDLLGGVRVEQGDGECLEEGELLQVLGWEEDGEPGSRTYDIPHEGPL